MTPSAQRRGYGDRLAAAAQSAGGLSILLALACFVGWMAGIATADQFPPLLAGAFAGSFIAAWFRHDAKPRKRRRRA